MKRTHTIWIASLLAMSAVGHAATLAINFTGQSNMSPTATAFGVAVGDWNNLAGNSGGPTNVTADNGDTASVTYSSGGTWTIGGTPTAGDDEVYHGYLDDGGTGASVTISGLSAIVQGSYSVQVIMGSDSTNGFDSITIGAATQTATASAPGWGATGSIGSTTFTGLTGDSVTIAPNNPGDALTRGSVAGVIVNFTPVPEPSTTALLGLGGLALILRRRK